MKKTIFTLLALGAIVLTACNTDKVNSFEFAQSEVSVESTKYVQVALNVAPANADVWVDWESDNENVAVLAGGSGSAFVRSVKGVAAGTATITAKVKGDLSKSASCIVKVYTVKADDIKFACATKEDSAHVDFATSTVTLAPFTSVTMIANVLPDSASFKNVTWISSADSVATINEKGIITAKSVGTATITASDYLGLVTKTLTVNVKPIPVEGLFVMAPASFKSLKGETKYAITNAYIISPATASNTKVIVTSSDTKVVQVLSADTIYTVKPGTATITVTTEDGGKTGTFEVTVVETGLMGFKISVDTIRMNVGEKYDIPCTFTPANATNREVAGVSDAPDVVEVIDGNTIKAVSAGKAVITLTAAGKYEAKVVVITQVAVQSISCADAVKTLNVGDEYEIAYTILPADASNKNVKVEIADDSILQLVEGAKVKALAVGKTTVTLTTEDGNKTDKIIIKVEETSAP